MISMIEHDKKIIIKIIKKYLPDSIIYLFGSRARKDNSATSDFDIALDAKASIDEGVMSAIRNEIEESIIPFKVDIIDLSAVSADFKNKILKEGHVWN